MFIYISFYKFNSHKFDYKNIEKDIHDKKDVKLRGAKVLISLAHISRLFFYSLWLYPLPLPAPHLNKKILSPPFLHFICILFAEGTGWWERKILMDESIYILFVYNFYKYKSFLHPANSTRSQLIACICFALCMPFITFDMKIM